MYFARLAVLALSSLAIAAPRSAVAQSTPAMPAAAQQALATVQRFIDAFNKGDVRAALATCAPHASIIDEVPPHEWQGANACGDWVRDLAAADKAASIADGFVTLGSPWRVDVNGSRAYLVMPATYRYKAHGKSVTERNSILTVALVRLGGAWRMTGWAWSAHRL